MRFAFIFAAFLVIVNSPMAYAQSTPQAIEIIIRGVNCTNAHPLKHQEFSLSVFERRNAPSSEKLKFSDSSDGKGITTFKFNFIPSYVEAGFFPSKNVFLPSGEIEAKVVLQSGVVIDQCGQWAKKRVPVSSKPGEITYYYSPETFWMKLFGHIWE